MTQQEQRKTNRRKISSPKKRAFKETKKEKIQNSLLDKMIRNKDFAAGIADAINKTKGGGDNVNGIDFDNLTFSQDYYGKVFNVLSEDKRVHKSMESMIDLESKDSVDFGKFLEDVSLTSPTLKEKENNKKIVE